MKVSARFLQMILDFFARCLVLAHGAPIEVSNVEKRSFRLLGLEVSP